MVGHVKHLIYNLVTLYTLSARVTAIFNLKNSECIYTENSLRLEYGQLSCACAKIHVGKANKYTVLVRRIDGR